MVNNGRKETLHFLLNFKKVHLTEIFFKSKFSTNEINKEYGNLPDENYCILAKYLFGITRRNWHFFFLTSKNMYINYYIQQNMFDNLIQGKNHLFPIGNLFQKC